MHLWTNVTRSFSYSALYYKKHLCLESYHHIPLYLCLCDDAEGWWHIWPQSLTPELVSVWIHIWLAWHSTTGERVVWRWSELTGMMTQHRGQVVPLGWSWGEMTGVNPEDQKGFQLTEQQGTNQATEETVNWRLVSLGWRY